MRGMSTQRADCVDQSQNDRCSQIAQTWAQQTFTGNESAATDAFAHYLSIPARRIALTSDGVGTKAAIAERLNRYDTIGFDLVAMVVDDLVASAARPLALSNILDVDRFDEQAIDDLMRGLATAARTAGICVAGGEIAQLGEHVGGYGSAMHFNWCATAVGVPIERPAQRPSRPGDRILALASDGFRSNGMTLARTALTAAFGDAWHNQPSRIGPRWGDLLLTPSRIYSPVLADLLADGVPMLSLAHVTGGGIPGNLPRALPPSTCAVLDDLWPPHDAMIELAEVAAIEPSRAYQQWNMGTAFFCIVPDDAADDIVRSLEKRDVPARIAGVVAPGTGVQIDARRWGMGCIEFRGSM